MEIRGISGVDVRNGNEGVFSTIWREPLGIFEAHPGTPIHSPRIPDLYD